jgi:hypothetical protein
MITYTATPSTAQPTDTFYTLKSLAPESADADVANLSTDNYPPDRVPAQDAAGYNLPNPANQIIFKNQPVSWWIDGLNSGSVSYTPVSNRVNWAYVDAQSNAIHMDVDITNTIIPNKTATAERNEQTHAMTMILVDNGVMNLTQTYNMFSPNMTQTTSTP